MACGVVDAHICQLCPVHCAYLVQDSGRAAHLGHVPRVRVGPGCGVAQADRPAQPERPQSDGHLGWAGRYLFIVGRMLRHGADVMEAAPAAGAPGVCTEECLELVLHFFGCAQGARCVPAAS